MITKEQFNEINQLLDIIKLNNGSEYVSYEIDIDRTSVVINILSNDDIRKLSNAEASEYIDKLQFLISTTGLEY